MTFLNPHNIINLNAKGYADISLMEAINYFAGDCHLE
jgi:hypothetical protein